MLQRVLYRLAAEALWMGLREVLRWRLRVRGLRHVPAAGGAVVAFNHTSPTDMLVCGLPVYFGLHRRPRFLAKQELFDNRLLGPFLRATGQIPVARGERAGRAAALDAAVASLRRGELVMVAPEQTVSPSFELLPFRTGAVRMAAAARVPVVPCICWGTQRFLAAGRRPRLAVGIPVSVRFDAPLPLHAEESAVDATRRLQQRMAVLLDEEIAAYPSRPRPGDDWWLPARHGGSAPPHDEVLDRLRRDRRLGADHYNAS